MSQKEPLLNAPWIILVLCAVMLGIHLSLFELWPQHQKALLDDFAFVPHTQEITRFFSFQYLHGNWPHVVMNTLGLLAFGTPVARKLGALKFLIFWTLCGVAGALAQSFVSDPQTSMVGASAGVSGLFAGALMVMQLSGYYAKGWRGLVPVSAIWIGINIVVGMVGMPGFGAFDIAWVAHIGGYLSGFVLFYLLSRQISTNTV